MSSVTKSTAPSTAAVAPSRAGPSTRPISSQFGTVSELYAQTSVRGGEDNRGYEDFNQGFQRQNQTHQQPTTLKLQGTSRTFALLFEDANQERNTFLDEDGYVDEDGFKLSNKPKFQAYVDRAINTYETSTQVVSGELKRSRGGSLNIAL